MIADFDPPTAGWARPRGAPRTRWVDTIAKDLHQLVLTLDDARPITQSQSQWVMHRALVGAYHAYDRRQWINLVDLFGSTHLPVHED